jgi:hypothetical protein
MKIRNVRGVARLATEAVVGVTSAVEGMHSRVSAWVPTLGRTPHRPARGIAGFAYKTVRAGARLSGAALDTSLAAIERLLPPQGEGAHSIKDGAWSPALLSALNGVVGDHLERTQNPLALTMQLVPQGSGGRRLLLLVHGLCMNDLQWRRKGHDHGRMLEASEGWSPVYVRYNSGRHVWINGLELAHQVEWLVQQSPVPVESLAIIGHSMGGLVARSAVACAEAAGMAWRARLDHLVHLGTPHHGAPLERGGHWIQALLEVSPYVASLARLAAGRSDSITDLRFGHVVEADWRIDPQGHQPARVVTPLPLGVRCYAVAGTLARQGVGTALGDGLVTVDSALGRHRRPSHRLRFPSSNVLQVPGAGHLDLLNDARVARQLRLWLGRAEW